MLEVAGVTKTFGGLTAVEGVSFSIGSGELVGLIGPNGAGKTTLFNTVTGVLRADSGTVSFQGTDITNEMYFRATSRPSAVDRRPLAPNTAPVVTFSSTVDSSNVRTI